MQEKEEKMFRELYDKYFHDVFLYLKSLCKNDSIAEELTQDTFFKAMKSLDKFKGDCDVRVWLCQIAKFGYYDYCRKNKLHSYEELSAETVDTGVSIETALEDSQTAVQIHRILHEMNEPYKEVFTLRVFGELSFRQIAELFGKTENWSAVTFHRAKMKIIDSLKEQGEIL